MKEALKKDRSRIQVGKMSMFGLLELSRQRMHSSFFESNYQVCPHCQGKGIVRTIESSAVYILRMIEEEGIKNRSSKINVYVPSETAIYLLNQKRQMLVSLEQKYKMGIVISADDSIKCVTDYKIERTKAIKEDAIQDQNIVFESDEKSLSEETNDSAADDENSADVVSDDYRRGGKDRRRGRNRFDRRGRNRFERKENPSPEASEQKEKQEAVILYNSHEDIKSDAEQSSNKQEEPTKEKSTWWKKLIKG